MRIVALAGGVGGAKLSDGLAQILSPGDLTIIVNTGDDFEHLGLHISPDLDTVCYTLAGIENPITGWGRKEDTFSSMEALHVLGGETWFSLGDKDLATHIERTRRLHAGHKLSQITQDFCKSWGIQPRVLPMTDGCVQTLVHTVEFGGLSFQDYFVKKRCVPTVKKFTYCGSDTAQPTQGLLGSIEKADAIVICPSNPWLSIDPILSLTGIRAAITSKKVVAVSPIIGGKTIKGPAAKIFYELGIQASALAVQQHYPNILNGFIVDSSDINLFSIGQVSRLKISGTNIIMQSRQDRRRLAETVLNFTLTL